MQSLGKKLVRLRNSLKLTQDQVATKLGISKQSYFRYENDVRVPPSETLKQLADIYGVSSDYLLNVDPPSQDTDEIMELREQLRRDPSTKMLFSLAKDATSDDIMVAVNVLKALKNKQ